MAASRTSAPLRTTFRTGALKSTASGGTRGIASFFFAVGCSVLLLTGCRAEINQSALHPAGPAASKIALLWWVMCAVFTIAFVFVLGLMLIAIFRRPGPNSAGAQEGRNSQTRATAPPLGRTGFIVAGGIVLPIVVVVPLLIYSLETSRALRPPKEALTIQVRGHMWWWEVHYPEQQIVTANEIHIPVGKPVRLELSSADVIHSFWVPNLHGKCDMIPGQINTFWLQAEKPGTYRGQCAEYCGRQHAKMAFYVIALPPDEFREWEAARQGELAKRILPPGTEEPRGLYVFRTARCITCHTIQGVPGATGKAGPDLTHIGSRKTIGAATLPNNRGNLAGWIANPQPLKPGIKMPASYIDSDDLMALVDYLEGLK